MKPLSQATPGLLVVQIQIQIQAVQCGGVFCFSHKSWQSMMHLRMYNEWEKI